MKKYYLFLIFCLNYISILSAQGRAAASPLTIHNINFSIWFFDGTLNESKTKQCIEKESLSGILKIDGKPYSFLEAEDYKTILAIVEEEYSLRWDKLLKPYPFAKEVYDKEISYYLTKPNIFGLSLDKCKTYTKSDWIMWTETLANQQKDFNKFIKDIYRFVIETESKAPISDWYETTNGKKVSFPIKNVVRGYLI